MLLRYLKSYICNSVAELRINTFIMSDKIKTEKKDKGVIKKVLGAGAAIASLALILVKKK